MNKTQRDLLAACYNKKIKAVFVNVDNYARNYKKYDTLRLSEIDEVVAKLKELRKIENN